MPWALDMGASVVANLSWWVRWVGPLGGRRWAGPVRRDEWRRDACPGQAPPSCAARPPVQPSVAAIIGIMLNDPNYSRSPGAVAAVGRSPGARMDCRAC